MESLSNTSTEMDFFSESANSFDNLLESMDEQINDLYAIVKNQNEEIEKLKIRIENLKSIIQSHLLEHLNKIIDYI
jgi:peptidoglycan hydrolase CwlO-like protein